MRQQIIDYLQRQAFPRTLREIANALKTYNQRINPELQDLLDNNSVSRSKIDGIYHYFIPDEDITMQTTTELDLIDDAETLPAPIKPVTAYPAKDGQLFIKEEDAVAHNLMLEIGPVIENYLKDKGVNHKAIGMQKSVIVQWETWRRQNRK